MRSGFRDDSAIAIAIAIHGIGFVPASLVAPIPVNEAGPVATLRADATRDATATLRADATRDATAEQWARAITDHVHRVSDANGVILLGFEDEDAMITARCRALGDTLAPVRGAPSVRPSPSPPDT